MRFNNNNIVYNKGLKTLENEQVTEVATYKGVSQKIFIYLFFLLAGVAISIFLIINQPALLFIMLGISIVGTLITGFLALISVKMVKTAGIIYCVLEGILLGTISLFAETIIPGVAFAAILATLSVLMIVSTLYTTGIVKVNRTFVRFLSIFSFSALLLWIILLLISLVAPTFFNIFGNTNTGLIVLISTVFIFLATLYLFWDLEKIRNIVEGGHPKQMEWFGAFGLIFTLIWLYVQILRILLMILANRD